MNVYILQAVNGRVVLSQENINGSRIIREIVAPNWVDARYSIEEYEFERRPGYGYLPNAEGDE
jgi:hypothetical protein